jgi:hypothetical protein
LPTTGKNRAAQIDAAMRKIVSDPAKPSMPTLPDRIQRTGNTAHSVTATAGSVDMDWAPDRRRHLVKIGVGLAAGMAVAAGFGYVLRQPEPALAEPSARISLAQVEPALVQVQLKVSVAPEHARIFLDDVLVGTTIDASPSGGWQGARAARGSGRARIANYAHGPEC